MIAYNYNMGTPKTTFDIAFVRGCDRSTVARAAKKHGIGQQVERRWLFTESEANKLVELIKDRGNPNFVKSK
jgi:hypothetical protein